MLEDYEKSEIINNEYLEKVMDVIFEAEKARNITDSSGRKILQLSDGNDIVNIYKKGLCYGINLDGTNFSSIVSENEGVYLYKNPKLGIEYKLNEIILNEKSSKKNSIFKIKDYISKRSYVDCDDELTLLYAEDPGEDCDKCIVYNKKLARLDYLDLKKFADDELKLQKELEDDDTKESSKKLPNDIDDFDFSEYEEMQNNDEEFLDELEEIDDIDLEKELEDFLNELNEQYEDYVCLKDNETINDENERTMLIQEIDGITQESDHDFVGISEMINGIIERYEIAINSLERLPEDNKEKENEKENKKNTPIEIINKSKDVLANNLKDEKNLKIKPDKSENQER